MQSGWKVDWKMNTRGAKKFSSFPIHCSLPDLSIGVTIKVLLPTSWGCHNALPWPIWTSIAHRLVAEYEEEQARLEQLSEKVPTTLTTLSTTLPTTSTSQVPRLTWMSLPKWVGEPDYHPPHSLDRALVHCTGHHILFVDQPNIILHCSSGELWVCCRCCTTTTRVRHTTSCRWEKFLAALGLRQWLSECRFRIWISDIYLIRVMSRRKDKKRWKDEKITLILWCQDSLALSTNLCHRVKVDQILGNQVVAELIKTQTRWWVRTRWRFYQSLRSAREGTAHRCNLPKLACHVTHHLCRLGVKTWSCRDSWCFSPNRCSLRNVAIQQSKDAKSWSMENLG